MMEKEREEGDEIVEEVDVDFMIEVEVEENYYLENLVEYDQ